MIITPGLNVRFGNSIRKNVTDVFTPVFDINWHSLWQFWSWRFNLPCSELKQSLTCSFKIKFSHKHFLLFGILTSFEVVSSFSLIKQFSELEIDLDLRMHLYSSLTVQDSCWPARTGAPWNKKNWSIIIFILVHSGPILTWDSHFHRTG